jgi:hypothetical protein
MIQIVLLDPHLKEQIWAVQPESLVLEKIQRPFDEPVPPGFEREEAVRSGYRLNGALFQSQSPEVSFEFSLIYLKQSQRIFNLALPRRHRVEDLSALLHWIQRQIAG